MRISFNHFDRNKAELVLPRSCILFIFKQVKCDRFVNFTDVRKTNDIDCHYQGNKAFIILIADYCQSFLFSCRVTVSERRKRNRFGTFPENHPCHLFSVFVVHLVENLCCFMLLNNIIIIIGSFLKV